MRFLALATLLPFPRVLGSQLGSSRTCIGKGNKLARYSFSYLPPDGTSSIVQTRCHLNIRTSLNKQISRRRKQYLNSSSADDVIRNFERNKMLIFDPRKFLQYLWALVRSNSDSNRSSFDFHFVTFLEMERLEMLQPNQINDILILMSQLSPDKKNQNIVGPLEDSVSANWAHWPMLDKLTCVEAAIYVRYSFNNQFFESEMKRFYGTLATEVKAMKEISLVKLCRVISLLHSSKNILWLDVSAKRYACLLLDAVESQLFGNHHVSETLHPQDVGLFLQVCHEVDRPISAEVLSKIANPSVLRPVMNAADSKMDWESASYRYVKCVQDLFRASRKHPPEIYALLKFFKEMEDNVLSHVSLLPVKHGVKIASAFTKERYYCPKLIDSLLEHQDIRRDEMGTESIVQFFQVVRDSSYRCGKDCVMTLVHLFEKADFSKSPPQEELSFLECAIHLGMSSYWGKLLDRVLDEDIFIIKASQDSSQSSAMLQMKINICSFLVQKWISEYGRQLLDIHGLLSESLQQMEFFGDGGKKAIADELLVVDENDDAQNAPKSFQKVQVDPLEADEEVQLENVPDSTELDHRRDFGLPEDILEDRGKEQGELSEGLQLLKSALLLKGYPSRPVHLPYMNTSFLEICLDESGIPRDVNGPTVDALGLSVRHHQGGYTKVAILPVEPQHYFINCYPKKLIGEEEARVKHVKNMGYEHVLDVLTTLPMDVLNKCLAAKIEECVQKFPEKKTENWWSPLHKEGRPSLELLNRMDCIYFADLENFSKYDELQELLSDGTFLWGFGSPKFLPNKKFFMQPNTYYEIATDTEKDAADICLIIRVAQMGEKISKHVAFEVWSSDKIFEMLPKMIRRDSDREIEIVKPHQKKQNGKVTVKKFNRKKIGKPTLEQNCKLQGARVEDNVSVGSHIWKSSAEKYLEAKAKATRKIIRDINKLQGGKISMIDLSEEKSEIDFSPEEEKSIYMPQRDSLPQARGQFRKLEREYDLDSLNSEDDYKEEEEKFMVIAPDVLLEENGFGETEAHSEDIDVYADCLIDALNQDQLCDGSADEDEDEDEDEDSSEMGESTSSLQDEREKRLETTNRLHKTVEYLSFDEDNTTCTSNVTAALLPQESSQLEVTEKKSKKNGSQRKCSYCKGLGHINRVTKGIPTCPKRRADEGH
ncbi:uncharacterized protein LOC106170647 isoform X2 [Lingula anatina]|uniref:Uncharacterized protein LOC106170647 isoform X2 n=1 Tax=Lingula anatina TaxID=7574 RepID=A0A1S3J6Y9_LINAN|nr:uncharacterized protein LOC106170647 isoform X2 [Lingula anatina]|eukprot:XP_013406073.1 uncharacterized protein LOC106170647 isoform X2 [Lingula anatina]